jgi:hypothetical protein
MYKLFQMEPRRDPEVLLPPEDDEGPAAAAPDAEPEDDVILEQDGIHVINKRVLNPDTEIQKNLDPKFLDLVESIIGTRGN